MAGMETWKRCISWVLVLVLLLNPVPRASAQTLPQETEAAEVTEATEVTEPTEAAEPTEATEAAEAAEVTEATEATEVTEATETTEATEATEATEVTETTEPTEAAEVIEETVAAGEREAALWSMPPVLSVAAVLSMTDREETVLLEGTVVFAEGIQAVLQDTTGGIRLSFPGPPEILPGDVLLVSGHRGSSGFSVEEFEKTGTADTLPAREATLTEGREAERILVKGAVLGYQMLSQEEYSCQMIGTVPEGLKEGARVDVWGVLLDGVLYADTVAASQVQEPEREPESSGDWNFYFGQLHAHTDISDGIGTVEEAFRYASRVDKLDFFAVTDHSNSFDNAGQGAVDADGTAISREWAAGKAAAKAVTDGSFVGLFGYEMTWPEDLAIGHINTFGTPGWQTRDQPGMHTLEGYLDALAAVPDAVSQFNHPGITYGDFYGFSEYSPQQDARVHLLEVGGEGSFRAYDAYTRALDAGWHLAPSNNQSNHNGHWGDAGGARTVVLAKELTEAAIYDAIRNYRVYATEDPDLKIGYRLNDRIMGSTIPETAVLTADLLLEDGSGDPVGRVEVVTEGGKVAACATVEESRRECSLEISGTGSYFYLRILRNDRTVAVTAPVWVEKYEDLGIETFTAEPEKPTVGTEAVLTLTLYNQENLPYTVETVTFAAGSRTIAAVDSPGSVAPLGKLEIPLPFAQDLPGAVTVTAAVTGRIAGVSRSFQKTVTLYFQAPKARKQPIGKVREGMLGEAYRIRGYVTAGTSKTCNSFPDSIYLQDDTGGIQITDFARTGIQLGTPMEIEGILRSSGGNLVLAMTDHEILEEDYHRHVPETMLHETAMDYEIYGGQLLQLEGHVVSSTATPDRQGVSRFTIRDVMGDLATVVVEDGIGSGAYGTNELAAEVKNTRCVRAIGLLHIDEYGKPVLRVRNCDEVAYVPPRKDPSNPGTGDIFARLKFWQ